MIIQIKHDRLAGISRVDTFTGYDINVELGLIEYEDGYIHGDTIRAESAEYVYAATYFPGLLIRKDTAGILPKDSPVRTMYEQSILTRVYRAMRCEQYAAYTELLVAHIDSIGDPYPIGKKTMQALRDIVKNHPGI